MWAAHSNSEIKFLTFHISRYFFLHRQTLQLDFNVKMTNDFFIFYSNHFTSILHTREHDCCVWTKIKRWNKNFLYKAVHCVPGTRMVNSNGWIIRCAWLRRSLVQNFPRGEFHLESEKRKLSRNFHHWLENRPAVSEIFFSSSLSHFCWGRKPHVVISEYYFIVNFSTWRGMSGSEYFSMGLFKKIVIFS